MTIQITSLEHAVELATPIFQTIHAAFPVGGTYLAGGYLRDADHNIQPKDMDFFVSVHRDNIGDPDPVTVIETQMALLGEQLGHKFKLLANDVVGRYPEGLRIYESEEMPEGAFPINLIFAVEVEHTQFDYGSCCIYFFGDDVLKTPEYIHDHANQIHTVMAWPPLTDRNNNIAAYHEACRPMLNHLARLQAKYDYRVMVSQRVLPNPWDFMDSAKHLGFQVFQLENHFGPSRTLLSPPRPIPEGDEVGLEDRDEDIRAAELGTARRDFNRAAVDRAVEALTRRVRDTPQVQPGFGGALAHEAWVAEARNRPIPDWLQGGAAPEAAIPDNIAPVPRAFFN